MMKTFYGHFCRIKPRTYKHETTLLLLCSVMLRIPITFIRKLSNSQDLQITCEKRKIA